MPQEKLVISVRSNESKGSIKVSLQIVSFQFNSKIIVFEVIFKRVTKVKFPESQVYWFSIFTNCYKSSKLVKDWKEIIESLI